MTHRPAAAPPPPRAPGRGRPRVAPADAAARATPAVRAAVFPLVRAGAAPAGSGGAPCHAPRSPPARRAARARLGGRKGK
eukprot:scaffold61734_cov63-Phaeocystis_antarctica.AAC.4